MYYGLQDLILIDNMNIIINDKRDEELRKTATHTQNQNVEIKNMPKMYEVSTPY